MIHLRDERSLGMLVDRAVDAELNAHFAEATLRGLRWLLAAEVLSHPSTASRPEAFRHDYPLHYHSRPGIWDDDNAPSLRGKPCLDCARWGHLLGFVETGKLEGAEAFFRPIAPSPHSPPGPEAVTRLGASAARARLMAGPDGDGGAIDGWVFVLRHGGRSADRWRPIVRAVDYAGAEPARLRAEARLRQGAVAVVGPGNHVASYVYAPCLRTRW
jgi:hypothetical protein